MADNVTLNSMTGGDTVAADDIGGVKFQRVKIVEGADGTNDGDVSSANPLPVVQTGALPAGSAAIGKLAANSGVDIGDVDITSIAAGDNNIGNVDIVTVPTDPFGANADAASATGSISAKLRRLATDLAAVISGSEIQADIVGSLPAGSAAIGKLAANSGVDIGDVDVTSIAAGSNIIGKVGHDISTIEDGVKTVTTAGTDVALVASSTPAKRVIIQAQTDNTGLIAIGPTGVDATEATGTGVVLYPGDAIELLVDNLEDIYVDATVDGEGVRFLYFT